MDEMFDYDRFEMPFESSDLPTKKRKNTPESTVAVYIILTLLLQMKGVLGLESMLEYMEEYRATMEKRNPKIKLAVKKALALLLIERVCKNGGMENKQK